MENTKQQDAVDERFPTTPIGIVRSRDAFLRDLPALLANPRYDRWSVAYCGEERIGIAASSLELLRECNRRGLDFDQYYIGCIFPHSNEEEEEVDFGLAEFEIEDLDGELSPNDAMPNP
jgi:hypothetical protein